MATGTFSKPAYQNQSAPKRVSKGSVSNPKPLPKWNPGPSPQNATPRRVKARA
jgi:hypothetical protein